MKENQIKYAELILKDCLKIQAGQPLLITAPIEAYEFIEIIVEEACKLGVEDIAFNITDANIKHTMLKNIPLSKLKNHPYFNKEMFNDYAKKNAAFLSLATEHPGLMEDIDSKILADVRLLAADTSLVFEDCRDHNLLAWCIAMVPTMSWAKVVYPNEVEPLRKLWETIFSICQVNQPDPIKALEKKLTTTSQICDKLNALKIKSLHYTNSKGTDLVIGLSKQSRWCSGLSHLDNGKDVLVNFPSEEVFTSPNKYQVNGIVYSSMPLLASGVTIEDFSLTFKDGKIIEIHAAKNEEVLKEIIHSVKNAEYLGEAALVPYNSPIRNQETLFYTTLLDENASCHLAFGSGFTECYEGSVELTDEEKDKIGLNTSKTHVDFMIGTEDLTIEAETYDGKIIPIFIDGNFSSEITTI